MTISLVGQEQPDFSGRWILADPARPDRNTPSALTVSQTLVRTTMRGDAMTPYFKDITIQRHLESGSVSESHEIGVEGGSVSGSATDAPKTIYRVWWEGTSLAFENGRYTGQSRGTGTWDERREVWSLDPDGRLRTVISIRSSLAEPRTVTLVYRRAP